MTVIVEHVEDGVIELDAYYKEPFKNKWLERTVQHSAAFLVCLYQESRVRNKRAEFESEYKEILKMYRKFKFDAKAVKRVDYIARESINNIDSLPKSNLGGEDGDGAA